MSSESVSTPQALAAARQSRGLSPEDVQRQLKLSVRQVNALESGDWAALPGKTFAQGMLRQYAKLLDVDASALLQAISNDLPPDDLLRPSSSMDEPLRPSGMLGFAQGGTGHRWAWLLLVLLGGIALVLFFSRGQTLETVSARLTSSMGLGESASDRADRASDSAASEAARSAPHDASSAPVAGTAVTSDSGKQQMAASSAPTSAPTSAASSAASPATHAASAVTSPDGSLAMLDLSFDEPCWIEVRQSDGKVVITGTQQAGAHLELSIKPPATLVAGNARHLSVSYRGRAFPLSLAPEATTARVTLP